VLFERFQRRAESEERHPGHGDHLNYDEFQALLLKGRGDVIEIGGIVYEIDTTDFGAIDYTKLIETILLFG